MTSEAVPNRPAEQNRRMWRAARAGLALTPIGFAIVLFYCMGYNPTSICVTCGFAAGLVVAFIGRRHPLRFVEYDEAEWRPSDVEAAFGYQANDQRLFSAFGIFFCLGAVAVILCSAWSVKGEQWGNTGFTIATMLWTALLGSALLPSLRVVKYYVWIADS